MKKLFDTALKKMIWVAGVVALIFIALIFVTNQQEKSALATYNPYGTEDLHKDTIRVLTDPNYQHIILPDELEEKLLAEEELTVYFFSPSCHACKIASPSIVSALEQKGVPIYQYNLLEFEEGWSRFGIESTPTVAHFINGTEVTRITGAHPEETYLAWIDTFK